MNPCFVPVQSVAEKTFSNDEMIQLTNDTIDYTALTESVRSGAAGAVVLFLGTVREITDGRQTIALDYEAFPQMAEWVATVEFNS